MRKELAKLGVVLIHAGYAPAMVSELVDALELQLKKENKDLMVIEPKA